MITKQFSEIRRLRIPTGLLLYLLIVLAWLAPAGLTGGWEYIEQIVFKQNVTRYVDPWHHYQPWYYYLTVIPVDFLPWVLFLPGSVVAAWKSFEGERRRAFLFLRCWVVVTVVFFSLSPAKRTVYILTMYPGMALATAAGLDRLAEAWPRWKHWVLWPAGGFALLMTAAVIAVVPVVRHQKEIALFPSWAPWVAAAGVGLVALGAIVATWLMWRGEVRRGVFSVALGTAVGALFLVVTILPLMDAVKSAKPLSKILVERMQPGDRYAIYPRLDAPFVFYTRKYSVEISGEEALRSYVDRPGRVWLLIERDDLEKLESPLPLVEVARDNDLREGYVLMTRP